MVFSVNDLYVEDSLIWMFDNAFHPLGITVQCQRTPCHLKHLMHLDWMKSGISRAVTTVLQPWTTLLHPRGFPGGFRSMARSAHRC